MNFSPVPAREYAVVWEVRPEEARGALFDFGMEQRLALRRTWRALRGAPLPSFLGLKQFRKIPVVVSLHPSLARTFILPFHFARKKSEGPVRPENLQGMLREFLSKTTFEMRRIACDALGVEELDAVLVDARLTDVLSDGVSVRDNRIIEGREIEGFLHVTFTTRAVFHDLHELLHSGHEIFFTEIGPAALAFLGRHVQGPLTFLDLEARGGWLFHVDRDAEEVIKKTEFRWSPEDLHATFSSAWGLSKKTAAAAYDMFVRGGFSERTASFASSLFQPIEDSFSRTITKTKASGKVYLRSTIPMPFKLPSVSGSAKLEKLPLLDMLEESGLSWDGRPGRLPLTAENSSFATSFLEYYYHRGDPRGHKALTRHIHWISS